MVSERILLEKTNGTLIYNNDGYMSVVITGENQPRKVIIDLKNSSDEAQALARQYSEGLDLKEQGGALSESDFIEKAPKFKETTYKLDAGQISEPVRSTSDYHIIKVTEKEELKPFNQEKEKKLELICLQDHKCQQKFFEELFKEADLKILDKNLKNTFKEFNFYLKCI